jgi:hypothetical protein
MTVKLDNTHICPEDPIRVLLPARMIPHDATVSKRTGELEYTLKHKLTMYCLAPETSRIPAPPIIVDGVFVVGSKGSINQVEPETMLHWHVTAEDLVDALRRSWETQQ